MSLLTKKPKLQVKRKRKDESPKVEMVTEEQPPASKFEKLQDGPTTEYYAAPKYAKMTSGDEFYAKDDKDNQFMLNRDGKPVYVTVRNIVDDNEHIVEMPPVGPDGKPHYIYDSDRIVYPMNLTLKRPAFPINENLDEEYITDNVVTEPHYPVDSEGNVYYARFANGDDRPLQDSDGNFYYATNGDGRQIYPKRSGLDDYYLTKGDFEDEFVALDENNIPQYAKNANGDEFYPRKRVE